MTACHTYSPTSKMPANKHPMPPMNMTTLAVTQITPVLTGRQTANLVVACTAPTAYCKIQAAP
jgi:hypothetical protein